MNKINEGEKFALEKKKTSDLVFLLYFGFPDWLRHSMIKLLIKNEIFVNENLYKLFKNKVPPIDFEKLIITFQEQIMNKRKDTTGKLLHIKQERASLVPTADALINQTVYDICKLIHKNKEIVEKQGTLHKLAVTV